MRNGRNNGWRTRITSSIPAEEFIHYWNITRREFTKVEFVTLRKAPLQSTTYHSAGYFINSSDGQITEELEQGLSRELGFKVGIEHRPASLDKRSADELWRQAKSKSTDTHKYTDRQRLFQNAPFAQQIYVADRKKAIIATGRLHQKYGKQTEDGQYPRLPDGSRMKFVPASIYLDMPGRVKAAELFKQQIYFQNHTTVAPIPVRDPMQRFESQENKTMQQLILDLLCKDHSNEPYFRHIRKKYYRNFKTKEYEVSIHNEMYPKAMKILKNLKATMTEKYGTEVGEALMEKQLSSPIDENDLTSLSQSGISLEADDRYLNGAGKFIILGMENVHTDGKSTLEELKQQGEDGRSLQVRSTATGLTGNTGNTVPEPLYERDIVDPSTEKRGNHSTNKSTNTNTSASTSGDTNEREWRAVGDAKAALDLAAKVRSACSPTGNKGEKPP